MRDKADTHAEDQSLLPEQRCLQYRWMAVLMKWWERASSPYVEPVVCEASSLLVGGACGSCWIGYEEVYAMRVGSSHAEWRAGDWLRAK